MVKIFILSQTGSNIVPPGELTSSNLTERKLKPRQVTGLDFFIKSDSY